MSGIFSSEFSHRLNGATEMFFEWLNLQLVLLWSNTETSSNENVVFSYLRLKALVVLWIRLTDVIES